VNYGFRRLSELVHLSMQSVNAQHDVAGILDEIFFVPLGRIQITRVHSHDFPGGYSDLSVQHDCDVGIAAPLHQICRSRREWRRVRRQ